MRRNKPESLVTANQIEIQRGRQKDKYLSRLVTWHNYGQDHKRI